jgi:hypothetical protein
MYRQTQRFIGISRFIDTWATCFDPSLGHPQALKAPYNGSVFFGSKHVAHVSINLDIPINRYV